MSNRITDIEKYLTRFPCPLTTQEENECLILMQRGDIKAKEKLILHNMRLVVHISKKFFALNENEDLISVGYFGLVKGLDNFKICKNVRLSTYLGRCIENEILMYLRKLKKHENCISLETALGKFKDEKEFKLAEILSDESNDNFIHQTNNFFDKDQVSGLITCLNERELKIISLRFGINDGISRSQQEVAQILGCSRSYISRLEICALNKMRDELKFNEKFRENNLNF